MSNFVLVLSPLQVTNLESIEIIEGHFLQKASDKHLADL